MNDIPPDLTQADPGSGFRFSDMRLAVGTRLQIELVEGGESKHYYSSLLGYARGEYLIVKMPFHAGLSVPLQEGDELGIRLLSGVHAFAFSSTVQRVFLAPLYYMHLSFPETIAGTVVREAPRVDIVIDTLITTARTRPERPLEARILNLSSSGALIESASAVGLKGEKIHMVFSFPEHTAGPEVTIRTDAVLQNLRHSRASEAGAARLFSCGVRFNELGEREKRLIENLVFRTAMEVGVT
jgi:c-di-GMP-binding flagellar brake protein YcgR